MCELDIDQCDMSCTNTVGGALKELITATHNQSKKYKFCW